MHDDTDLFAFPDLSDEAVVALDRFLEDLYTAYQNHYFAQMHRYYHDLAQREQGDDQMPLPLDPRSDRPDGVRRSHAAVHVVRGPSPIVKISPSNQLTALTSRSIQFG